MPNPTHEFWLERWRSGQTGWYQAEVNPQLRRWWPGLGIPRRSTILVPLCGSSLDMVWLADQGHTVLGVELSEQAADEFFQHRNIIPAMTLYAPFIIYRGGPYTIYVGDIFELHSQHTQHISGIYDRAALIALSPEQRKRYAAHLRDLAPAGTRQLLLTIDYDQSKMPGPPFSVTPDEIHTLYAADWQLAHLVSLDISDQSEKLRESGVPAITEHVFMLE